MSADAPTSTGGPPPPQPPQPPDPPPPPAAAVDQPETAMLVLRDKVQRYLTDAFGTVQVAQGGTFSLQAGSAHVFVSCQVWEANKRTLVQLASPVLQGCAASPELFEHIATHADDYLFGHLSARRAEDSTVNVWFTHTLLGDYLDPEELEYAVGAVGSTTNQLDDELRARFGGRRFHEDAQ